MTGLPKNQSPHDGSYEYLIVARFLEDAFQVPTFKAEFLRRTGDAHDRYQAAGTTYDVNGDIAQYLLELEGV